MANDEQHVVDSGGSDRKQPDGNEAEMCCHLPPAVCTRKATSPDPDDEKAEVP